LTLPDLEVDSLVKRFADHSAVDDLSFTVERGSFFSILGPSGCGKTTLLRMIAGFIAPDSGDIRIGGRSMQAVAPNRRPVNMVFQQLALFPMMSVGENVAFGLARRGMGKEERGRRAAAMLERVSLAGAAHKRVDELSGGQRQRVAIARSLVLEPTLLLLDEPLGALDLKLREHMKIELKQLQAAFGTTFVYITHDQSEALVLSDHVAVMNRGRFEQRGTPQDLYYQPATAFVAGFVGANNRIAGRVVQQPGRCCGGCDRAGLARARAQERRRGARRRRRSVRAPRDCSPRTRRGAPAQGAPAPCGRRAEPAVRRRQFRRAAHRGGKPLRISRRAAADGKVCGPQGRRADFLQLRPGAGHLLRRRGRGADLAWRALPRSVCGSGGSC
jgi:ABC-type Fe3+/spermidine/putrescine transport system ATPase subunit